MRTQRYIFITFSIAFVLFFSNVKASLQIIDHADSVVIDMSQAIVNGNVIDIPVSILSDDTVYALDFALKYNHANLLFDSIINTTPYISSFYYYNTSDSVLRFTSNSLHPYANDSQLVFIRFTMLNSVILSSDIYEMYSYLNGDTCSTKFTPYLPLGIEEARNYKINVYPNPASGNIKISGAVNSTLVLYDANGNKIDSYLINNNLFELDLANYKKGVYILRSAKTDGLEGCKFLLQ